MSEKIINLEDQKNLENCPFGSDIVWGYCKYYEQHGCYAGMIKPHWCKMREIIMREEE